MGIVAISGPPALDLIDSGAQFLESLGYHLKEFISSSTSSSYLAGSDQDRIHNLMASITDPDVCAILMARGGYGAMRILDKLDYKQFLRHHKMIIGMSDITALQLALYHHVDYVTFSGPMLAGQIGSGLDQVSRDVFVDVLQSNLREINFWPSQVEVNVVHHGNVKGPLLGGCLSLITSLLGTQHSPSYKGSILFLEDVNEPLYRLDRMLCQLKLAGIMDEIRALILGYFIDVNGNDLSEQVLSLISEFIPDNNIPILLNFPHGHQLPNITLPHGAHVELDTKSQLLRIL